MVAIFVLSSRPLPSPGQAVPDWLSHGTAWAVLAWLLARSQPARSPVGVVIVTLLVAIGYGALDEWHQSFVPGRHADAGDVLKDAVGSAIGVALHQIGRRSAPERAAPPT